MPADDFQSRMLKYIKYGLSIRTTETDGVEYYLVGINFKSSWKVVEPLPETKVHCVPATDGEGLFYYFSEVTNGVNSIFDSIEETIRYNEDVEKKVKLLKEKILEMQELFATESYETLTTLKFTMEKPKSKRGRSSKKAQTEEHKPNCINEETEDKAITGNMTTGDTNDETGYTTEGKEETTNNSNNAEEASEIDAKIDAALGKK